jgi:hypothetical protein
MTFKITIRQRRLQPRIRNRPRRGGRSTHDTMSRMSGIAGILLIVYGSITAYLGYAERVSKFHSLTTFATDLTIALGVALTLLGLAHFKAPHKTFLATIPALLYFHVQMYFNALFYFEKPMWAQQLSLLGISLGILGLSYLGYSGVAAKKEAA